MSLKDLAELLVEIHRNGRYELVAFPEDRKTIDIGDYYADFTKVETLLGWLPQVPLQNGLQQTLEYYREHHAHYWD